MKTEVGFQTLELFRWARFRLVYRALDPLLLPPYKGSTFRGPFGGIFHDLVCTHSEHKRCLLCPLHPTCPYALVFEPSPPAEARMMQRFSDIPRPFVIEPEPDQKTAYAPGERFTFDFLVFGKAIQFFPYFVLTFRDYGERGIGKGRGRVKLEGVDFIGQDGVSEVYREGENLVHTQWKAETGEELFRNTVPPFASPPIPPPNSGEEPGSPSCHPEKPPSPFCHSEEPLAFICHSEERSDEESSLSHSEPLYTGSFADAQDDTIGNASPPSHSKEPSSFACHSDELLSFICHSEERSDEESSLSLSNPPENMPSIPLVREEPGGRKLEFTLHFQTITRLTQESRVVSRPEFPVLIRNLARRLSALMAFYHDTPLEIDYPALFTQAESVQLVRNETRWRDWERYSRRQQKKMEMGGLVGQATYQIESSNDFDPFIPFLLLGEVSHVGKGVVFGLGKYRIIKEGSHKNR